VFHHFHPESDEGKNPVYPVNPVKKLACLRSNPWPLESFLTAYFSPLTVHDYSYYLKENDGIDIDLLSLLILRSPCARRSLPPLQSVMII
jgi:hypothetical protein